MVRKHPLLISLTFLLLAALACQAPTLIESPAGAANQADIAATAAAVAVATVEAGLPTPAAAPAVTGSVPGAALDTALQSILIDLYERVNPAVVHIFVRTSFGVLLGSGSGFVIDTDGHIVTNNHVVAEGEALEVAFADGGRQRAELLGTDVDSDLAVIKVETLPDGVVPVPLGDSAAVQAGQLVIAIGNPFGEVGSMSLGIVSGLGRTLESMRVPEGGGFYSLPDVLQTDAAINPGNSGGPLLNLDGEVIGVNSAILTRTGANSGVGFSIPVAAVHRVVPALIADGVYIYPYIGVSMAPPLPLEALEELNLPAGGVLVTSVVPGTPAEEAGLIGSNGPGADYILAVDGNPIADSSELISYLIFQTEVGQTVELTVLRGGEQIVVPVTLGARP